MITMFHVMVVYGYVGPDVDPVGAEDVLREIEAAEVHYDKAGLGDDLDNNIHLNTFTSKISRKERSRQRAKAFFLLWCHGLCQLQVVR